MEENYRMYCFVLKQLNPIQKGIQSAHAIVEYGNHYFMTDEYHKWSTKDKTIIMLDGGTSPELYELVDELRKIQVPFAFFMEPDLNNLITSVCLLVSNDIYDNEDLKQFEENVLPGYNRDYELYKLISRHRLSF